MTQRTSTVPATPAPALDAGSGRPAPVDADLWTAVGRSTSPDATIAVGEALAQALPASGAAGAPTLLMAFVAPSLDRDAVAAAITAGAPGVPLVGCTGKAQISGRGEVDDTVVVMALGGADTACATALVPIVDGDARAAAAEAAACALVLPDLSSKVVMVLVDGFGIDVDDVVRGAYDSVGPSIPLVGGGAAGEVQQIDVGLFHQSGADGAPAVATGRSVLVAAVASAGPIGIGVAHGCAPIGQPMVVTSSELRTVETLDETPALDTYLARHRLPESLLDDPVAFADAARSRPVGIVRRDRIEPRSVLAADRDARTLLCAGPVAQGGLVWLMDGDVATALDAVEVAADLAIDGAGGRARAMVAFDCGARWGMLGPDGMHEEMSRLTAHAACPIAGLYTFGEIARTSGTSGYHNQTIVLLAFG